jgi:tetratricopeptide (TPR) repeat protein
MRNGRIGTGKGIRAKSLFSGFFALLSLSFSLLVSACSSVPKNPAELRSLRNMGESRLEIANQEMDRGNYAAAVAMLEDAWRIAVSSDDPSLRIRTALSRGSAYFALGRREEAYAVWHGALAESEGAGELHAVCLVYIARADLLSLRAVAGNAAPGEASPDRKAAALRVRQDAGKAVESIKDPFYTAFTWMVISMADKELGNYREAEASARRALSIHEKTRSLVQAAFDWYFIASIRSVAGDYAGAVQALTEAIGFDRRAENGYGLAMDWRALGDVHKKAGDAAASEAACRRSEDIFRSLEAEGRAADSENRAQ